MALRRKRDENIGATISTTVDTTYARTVKILQKLEDQGYVDSCTEGMKRPYSLTEEERDMADLLGQVLDIQDDRRVSMAIA